MATDETALPLPPPSSPPPRKKRRRKSKNSPHDGDDDPGRERRGRVAVPFAYITDTHKRNQKRIKGHHTLMATLDHYVRFTDSEALLIVVGEDGCAYLQATGEFTQFVGTRTVEEEVLRCRRRDS